MKPVRIEYLSPETVGQAAAVEKQCLSTAWSADQLSALPPVCSYFVAFAPDGVLCGIASLYCVSGEAEIQNLAVLPPYRRSGVAQSLLDRLFAEAVSRSCPKLVLEVAEHNIPARTLYQKNGFVPVGTRKGFYRGENALVLQKQLQPERTSNIC